MNTLLTNPYTHSYGYDLSGNVTHLDGSLFATYNAANEADSIALPGGVVQNFDARVHEYKWNGIVGGNFLFEDDFTIRLRSFGGGNEENFRTDGHGRRVLTWLPPNTAHVFYIFDGDELIGEISRDGVPQMAYTWGNGLASLRNIQTSQSRYYHFGPQGETRYLTNSIGTVTDTYNFTAYGVPVASTGTTYNPHQYGGKYGYYKRGIGQQLLVGHRWYSPYLMRWLTYDPIGYEGGTNLYEYVGGNPVRYVDPDGLIPLDTVIDIAILAHDIRYGDSVDIAIDIAGVLIPYVPVAGIKIFRPAIQAATRTAECGKIAAVPTIKQIRKFQQQLENDGLKAVLKSQKTITANLAQHQKELIEYTKLGGKVSSIKREIRNFERELAAIKQVLEER